MPGVQGLDRLRRRFEAISSKVQSNLAGAVAAGAERVAESIRAESPVRTGAMKGSVASTPVVVRGGVAEATVEVAGGEGERGVPAHVEFGTRDMAADPFVRPGTRKAVPLVRGAIASAVGRSVR